MEASRPRADPLAPRHNEQELARLARHKSKLKRSGAASNTAVSFSGNKQGKTRQARVTDLILTISAPAHRPPLPALHCPLDARAISSTSPHESLVLFSSSQSQAPLDREPLITVSRYYDILDRLPAYHRSASK